MCRQGYLGDNAKVSVAFCQVRLGSQKEYRWLVSRLNATQSTYPFQVDMNSGSADHLQKVTIGS